MADDALMVDQEPDKYLQSNPGLKVWPIADPERAQRISHSDLRVRIQQTNVCND
jgi:hypothetical protein